MILSKHGAILAAEAITRRDGEAVDYRAIDEDWDYEDYRSLVETDTLKLTQVATNVGRLTVIDEHRNVVGWL